MTDNTSRTLTDDRSLTEDGTERRELHTEDLVASGAPERGADRSIASPTATIPAASTTATATGARTDEPSETSERSDVSELSGASRGDDGSSTPLVGDVDGYRRRWEAVQTGFVDEPRRAVENADALVAEVITELATSFAQERGDLEGQWSKGDQVSTEDLRVSLRRYRSFFDRLLSA